MENIESNSPGVFGQSLHLAVRIPGVRVDRADYLRQTLSKHCTDEQVLTAVEETPAAAGIAVDLLKEIARDSIAYETTKVTALSAVAGIPGGFALIGTIPADSAQYLAHMLRVAQKLAYLYSWPDLFDDDGDEPDDGTQNVLILFIGVMFGVQAANKGIGLIAERIAAQIMRQLPKQALTHGVVYPVVKTVAKYLGVQMTKSVFAKGLAKAVPVVGAVLSGGMTFATFLPMARRLDSHLSALPLAQPPTTAAAA